MSVNLAHFRYRLTESPELITLLTFLLVFVFFAFAAQSFLTPLALSNILTFASVNGIVVIGVAILMISGEFDLSVGSTLAVAGYLFAIALNAGAAPLLALAFALLICALLGLVNGLIVTLSGIPSFITTLGTMLAYRGVVRAIGGGDFVSYSSEKPLLFDLLNGSIDPLNNLFHPAANFRGSTLWFIGLAIIMSLVLMRTQYGNWIFAAGGNPGAARAQGVHVNQVKVINFVLTGLLAGFAGVVQFSQRFSIDPLRGEGVELVAVAASVIGGVMLSGGLGNLVGASLGILLLSMLEQGLVLMQLPIQVFRAVAGAILILSVAINLYLNRRE